MQSRQAEHTVFDSVKALLLVLVSLPAHSQTTLRFEEFARGKKIGEIVITQSDSAGEIHYTLNSFTEFKMLFADIQATISAKTIVGKDGLFLSSTYQGKRKEKASINVNTIRKGDKILVEKDGKKHNVSGSAGFSTLQLYFTEPANIFQLFSERTGEFVEVKHLGNHRYSAPVSSLKGIYTYVNGKLTEIEASTPFGTLYIKLAE